ncbi:MAG: flagellar basal body rod protein FlgC [Acidobacteria bacterium]|nr:flagellar basal body rod protein FlgC [Acidobacteriota bacterium]
MLNGAYNATTEILSGQRHKMNTVAENIAQAEITRTAEGGPYQRQRVVFKSPAQRATFGDELHVARLTLRRSHDGHRVSATRPSTGPGQDRRYVEARSVTDENSVRLVYDPSHPDADDEGYVAMPNVEIITEMVDLMSAQRSYEANLTTVEAVKMMVSRSLEI